MRKISRRWKLGLVLCGLLLCIGFCLPNQQFQAADETETMREIKTVSRQKHPVFTKRVTMEPKDTYTLALDAYVQADSISIISENPEIVKAGKTGTLKALRCGNTVVKATITDGSKIRTIKVKVCVKYDQYMQKVSHGQILKKGNQRHLALSNLAADAQVEYRSSKPEVAAVSTDGAVSAKQSGTTKITIVVRQNDKKYVFYDSIDVYEQATAKVTEKERDQWFSDSGFIGSSMGVGQKNYFQSQGKNYLGNPTMMVRGCYSFINDAASSSDYKVTYNGTPYTARMAIKKSGVKKVFINMGMNDLWESPEGVYKRYVDYLDGIRKENPSVVIFIESTTPVASGNEGKKLSNKNVNKLNQLMKKYCASQNDMYYIDVNTCLRDSSGTLKSSYSSDGHVHLNMAGYAQWMNALCAYTDKLMIAEQKAQDAVETAVESAEKADYETALELLAKLEKSTFKSQLEAALKKVKKQTDVVASAETLKASELPDTAKEEIVVIEPEDEVKETEVEIEEKLAQVASVKVTAKSNTSLRLDWEKTNGAGYYRIYRATEKKGTYKEIAGTKKNAYIDKTCKKNTKYYYKLRACVSKKDTSRDSKYSKIAACRTKNIPGKVVLAGDSIMKGVSEYNLTDSIDSPGKKYVVAGIGLGTLTFQTKAAFGGATGVEKVISYKPDRLYLMLGMNELSYRSQTAMLNNYKEILDQIRKKCSQTEIVLLAVSPVSQSAAAKQKGYTGIAKWNQQLKNLARDYDCYYFNYAGCLSDANGYLKYNGGDGIHWSYKGYQAFLSQITEFEKKLNG